jgi:PTS system nitrogen regulatory IIA component
MNIRDFLSPTDVMVDVRASDKAHLLRRLSVQAAANTDLDPDEVSAQIAKREELGFDRRGQRRGASSRPA